MPRLPRTDDTLMITPPVDWARMRGTAALQANTAPQKLVSITRRKSSSDCSSKRAAIPTPALFTSASMRPNRVTACSINRSTWDRSETSVRTARTSPPLASISVASSRSRSSRRPATTTRAWARANSFAVSRPIPLVAPVITTVLARTALGAITASVRAGSGSGLLGPAPRRRPGRLERFDPELVGPSLGLGEPRHGFLQLARLAAGRKEKGHPHPGLGHREGGLLQLAPHRRRLGRPRRTRLRELAHPRPCQLAPAPGRVVPELLRLSPAVGERLGAGLPHLRDLLWTRPPSFHGMPPPWLREPARPRPRGSDTSRGEPSRVRCASPEEAILGARRPLVNLDPAHRAP